MYMAEGAGSDNTSEVILMNPVEPYNTTVLVNNYFGRQFSSLNDVAVHPSNKDLYFTDTLYGYLQDFRPPPGLRNQVYRWNDTTGAVTVVADGFTLPNGVLCSALDQSGYLSLTLFKFFKVLPFLLTANMPMSPTQARTKASGDTTSRTPPPCM